MFLLALNEWPQPTRFGEQKYEVLASKPIMPVEIVEGDGFDDANAPAEDDGWEPEEA